MENNKDEYQVWLKRKLVEYNGNKEKTLEYMLHDLVSVLDQFVISESNASRSVLLSALKCNKMFLETIDPENK